MGGGAFALHLLHYFTKCHVTSVDIDGEMVEIAKTWFGLGREDIRNRHEIHVTDAEELVTKYATGRSALTFS